jgi:peptidoglycan/xylan/chitin deacetylase (PgdA/CDA1 family)
MDITKTPGTLSFTFDDGVSKNMAHLLDILDQEGIVGTFFLIGESLKLTRNVNLATDAHKRGHILANHTFTHPDITKISVDEFKKELDACEHLLNEIRGNEAPKFFRPPYGAINSTMKEVLLEKGYTYFLWNIDMRDWDVKRSKQRIRSDYTKFFVKADPTKSSLISLQHDRRLASVDLVPEIAELAKDKGFKIVPLSISASNFNLVISENNLLTVCTSMMNT